MGTDIEKIVLSFRQVHEMWASALEIAVAVWLLERQIGAASAVPGILAIGTVTNCLQQPLIRCVLMICSWYPGISPLVRQSCTSTNQLA